MDNGGQSQSSPLMVVHLHCPGYELQNGSFKHSKSIRETLEGKVSGDPKSSFWALPVEWRFLRLLDFCQQCTFYRCPLILVNPLFVLLNLAIQAPTCVIRIPCIALQVGLSILRESRICRFTLFIQITNFKHAPIWTISKSFQIETPFSGVAMIFNTSIVLYTLPSYSALRFQRFPNVIL